jgi:formylglycine-generating enzyme required for sulfatase activity
MAREGLIDSQAYDLGEALGRLALGMQTQPEFYDRESPPQKAPQQSAQTVIVVSGAVKYLSRMQLSQAHAASLIDASGEVRFTHQLLQEYFAARRMQGEIAAGRLNASDLWPAESWWERNAWEEATLLLAGTHTEGILPVLHLLADAQPEMTARCIVESGAERPDDAVLLNLRERWLPRLTDTTRDPDPRARAAIGRAFGLLRLRSGEHLDNRTGVALRLDGVPDIQWIPIPAGHFIYGEVESGRNWLDAQVKKLIPRPRTISLPAFRIARYPITYAQFQSFLDAEDGWRNTDWWARLSASEDDRTTPGDQNLKYWNHPRERVSWYDAMAYCRWLSARLGLPITLPTEQQWERAARYTDGRKYPWGNGYEQGRANTSSETARIGRSSAAGLYPDGRSEEGVDDLAGNVWEWCLNEHAQPKRIQAEGAAIRVVRGGSWIGSSNSARAAYRDRYSPGSRYNGFGFRVVVGVAPVS